MANTSTKRQELMVRIICVICAFGLWLFVTNSENPTRTYELKGIPVELINAETLKDSNLIVSPGQEDITVSLNIEGPTTEVFSVKPSEFKLKVDLSDYALKKGENSIPVEISDYPPNISIKSTGFPRVKIIIDEYVKKSIPVYSDLNITTKQGAYSSEPTVNPTNGLISGPLEYVNKVKYLLAKGDVTNADKDVSISLPLTPVDENMKEVPYVDVEPSNANITVPIRQSKFLTINVKTKGTLPNGLSIKSIEVTPDKLEVIGDEAVLNKLTTIDTEPIDLSALPENGEVNAKVIITDKISLVNSKSTVLVKINTVKKVQKTLTVPVTLTGVAEGFTGSLENTSITVVAEAEEGIIDTITPADFKAEVNAQGLKEGNHQGAINVTSSKSDVRIINYNPEVTVITITKK